jgi:hypothetical protein
MCLLVQWFSIVIWFSPFHSLQILKIIRQGCQAVVDDNRCRQNLCRLFHDYNVGDEVLIINQNKNKPTLVPASIGPFAVQQAHVNVTVTIIRAPNVFE